MAPREGEGNIPQKIKGLIKKAQQSLKEQARNKLKADSEYYQYTQKYGSYGDPDKGWRKQRNQYAEDNLGFNRTLWGFNTKGSKKNSGSSTTNNDNGNNSSGSSSGNSNNNNQSYQNPEPKKETEQVYETYSEPDSTPSIRVESSKQDDIPEWKKYGYSSYAAWNYATNGGRDPYYIKRRDAYEAANEEERARLRAEKSKRDAAYISRLNSSNNTINNNNSSSSSSSSGRSNSGSNNSKNVPKTNESDSDWFKNRINLTYVNPKIDNVGTNYSSKEPYKTRTSSNSNTSRNSSSSNTSNTSDKNKQSSRYIPVPIPTPVPIPYREGLYGDLLKKVQNPIAKALGSAYSTGKSAYNKTIEKTKSATGSAQAAYNKVADSAKEVYDKAAGSTKEVYNKAKGSVKSAHSSISKATEPIRNNPIYKATSKGLGKAGKYAGRIGLAATAYELGKAAYDYFSEDDDKAKHKRGSKYVKSKRKYKY